MSDCTHPAGSLDPQANGRGEMRVVCKVCGQEGPWKKGLILSAIRGFNDLARRTNTNRIK